MDQLVRCVDCGWTCLARTTDAGERYLVGAKNRCNRCEGADFTEITPESLGMSEQPARVE